MVKDILSNFDEHGKLLSNGAKPADSIDFEDDDSDGDEDSKASTERNDGVYVNPVTGEVGGPKGPEPVRYGDWESKGRCIDF